MRFVTRLPAGYPDAAPGVRKESVSRFLFRVRTVVVKRVFLVEDLHRLHGLLGELFESIGGFEVLGIASTEAEAIAWLEEHPDSCDLAVVDLMLEQGSGL